MIRILPKLRRQLLSNQKFTKYLLYAVGEVILIVIGILIALGINNWNQKRIVENREQFYLAGLKNEFLQSKRKLEKLVEVNRLNYESAKKLAHFITTADSAPALAEPQLSALLYQAFAYEIGYNPNNSLLAEIISSGSLKDISNPALRTHLTSWESHIQQIHQQEAALRLQREEVLNLFREGAGSIRTILDHTNISSEELGLPRNTNASSNAALLQSAAFENNLLLFMLTSSSTESTHYTPLLEEIDTILALIESEQEQP